GGEAATVEEPSYGVIQQACPAGVASRLKVVTPPGSDPRSRVLGFTDVQGTLYFVTDPLDGTTTLWKSDGTDAGTVQVRAFPAAAVGFPRLTDLVAVGNRLFFQLYDPATGTELWVSDGTTSGTRLVRDITPGASSSSLRNLTEVNGRLVFFRQVPATPTEASRVELWRSDGTTTGTLRVRNFGENPGLGFDTLKVGNALLFFFSQPTGTTLWRTDGTLAGTTSVERLDADSVPITQVGRAGDLGLFILQDGPNHEVWRTTGTAAGTVRLDAFGKPVRLLGSVGSSVYLSSADLTTRRLRIDRLALSGGGKALVTTLPNPYASNDFAIPYVQNTAISGSQIYFSVAISSPGPSPLDVTLWVTNGTAAGTRDLFRQLSRSDEYISPVFATGAGVVLFSGSPEGGFTEPWFTRGTVATTGQLADIRPGPGGSSPDGFTRVGSRVYFAATDDTNLAQVWSSPVSFICPPGLTETTR
ncbi:ELWxxDGT repeat protein, partial [Corallococcus llansteffanensis]